jgi:hypothetical protein
VPTERGAAFARGSLTPCYLTFVAFSDLKDFPDILYGRSERELPLITAYLCQGIVFRGILPSIIDV